MLLTCNKKRIAKTKSVSYLQKLNRVPLPI